MTDLSPPEAMPKGIIGRSYESGMPVIWSFVHELPSEAIRSKLPWLTVISWDYDGASHNGFPDEATSARQRALEEALAPLEEADLSVSAYRRTGNGLKEFAFYSASQDSFLQGLNNLLTTHERYPIDIRFFEDRDWSDFRGLLHDFPQT